MSDAGLGALGSLGRLSATVGLNTGPLAAGVAQSRALFTQLDTASASSFGALGISAQTAGIAAGVAVGAIAVASVHAAEALEASNARLATAIQNVGGSFAAYSDQIDSSEKHLEGFGFTNADTADSLARLTTATRDPAKAMGDLGLAADLARGRNSSLEFATTILTKVETGHVALLGRLGIATKDATGATISQEEAIRRLSELYGGQAAAYSETLAGKTERLKAQFTDMAASLGEYVIPLLSRFLTGLERIGGVVGSITNSNPAKAVVNALDDTLGQVIGVHLGDSEGKSNQAAAAAVKLGDAFGSVTVPAAQAAGAVQDMGQSAEAAFKADDALAGAVLKLPDANQAVADSAEKVASAEQSQGDARDKLNQLLSKGAVDSQAVADAQNALEQSSHSLEASQRALGDAQDKLSQLLAKGPVDAAAVASAQNALEQSSHSLESAQRSLVDAQAKVHDLMAKGPVDAQAVADSQDRVRQSSHSLRNAQDALAAAQQHLNDVLKGASADELAHGMLSLREATLGVAQAKQSEADAQQRLTDALKGNDPNAIADAELALQASHLGIQAAQLRLTDSRKALNESEAKGKEGSKDLADARKQLQTAEDGVTSATQANRKAQEELAKAEAGDPEFQKKLAAARQGVSDAEWSLRQSTEAHKAAQDALNKAQAGDPEFQKKVRDARQAVSDAEWALHESTLAHAAAQRNLSAAEAGDPEFQKKLAAARRDVAAADREARAAGQARADALVKQDIAIQVANGAEDTHQLHVQATIDRYRRFADTLAPGNPLRAHLLQVADMLDATYNLHLSTQDAENALRIFGDNARTALQGIYDDSHRSILSQTNNAGFAPDGRPLYGPPIPGHAAGGLMKAGEWSWLGEQGPELGHLTAGGLEVFPANTSARMVSEAFNKMKQIPMPPVRASIGGGSMGNVTDQPAHGGSTTNYAPTFVIPAAADKGWVSVAMREADWHYATHR